MVLTLGIFPPRKDKYIGLFFSTISKSREAVTIIEALNATGLVYVVRDGATHVSVRPVYRIGWVMVQVLLGHKL